MSEEIGKAGREIPHPRVFPGLSTVAGATSRGSVTRLSLGRRLVNLLPVAQRTNAFTNGVVGRTMGRWS